MNVFFYNIFLRFYHAGIYISSLWNAKAKKWVAGRKDIFRQLMNATDEAEGDVVWVHCSSLGEFEQGRPVIESIKQRFPDSRLLLSFYSPSGYEIRKDYKGADLVFYLPADSASHAKLFFDIIDPSLVIFVKYDFWYHYLHECKQRRIPLLLISGIFRSSQPFFKWYGSLHRKMLSYFRQFFVQDNNSAELLRSLRFENVKQAGDTRIDRVLSIAESPSTIAGFENIKEKEKILVAGSTWPRDEQIIIKVMSSLNMKLIIAPHEIHKEHLSQLSSLFPNSVFYSEFLKNNSHTELPSCLIIDNIGMLARLYKYADICYVGGGFDSGIHNILEAAVYNKPVIFGPKHSKFREANELIKLGAAYSVDNADELLKISTDLLQNSNNSYALAQSATKKYFEENKGATEIILNYIQEKRLLTS